MNEATHPNAATAPAAPRTATSPSVPTLALRAASAAVALGCVGAGLALTTGYPVRPLLVMGLFLGWTIVATANFSIAFSAMLALLPVLGFAPWTGWLTFEETDLMVLASAAGGYAAVAFGFHRPDDRDERRFGPQMSIFAMGLLVLLLVSLSIALVRGVEAAGGFRFDWFQGYNEPLNSLRIYKSFPWALLLAPLLLREMRRPGFFDRLGMALTVSLGLCGASVVSERLAFTGLLDFSADYRATGSFWENHVGGVALEGFLALTIPFAVREAIRPIRERVDWVRVVGASGAVAVAVYACFVTFTRGLYLAVPSSLLLLLFLIGRQRRGGGHADLRATFLFGPVFGAVAAVAAFFVFRHGGYRAVMAMLMVIVLAIPLETILRRSSAATHLASLVGALLLGAFAILVATVVPKGVYVVFAALFFATVATVALTTRTPARALDVAAIAGWLALVACACNVARYWGGDSAFREAAATAVVVVGISYATLMLSGPIHAADRQRQLATAGFVVLAMGAVAIFNAGSFAGERLNLSSGDLSGRMAHWKAGIDRMRGFDDWAFGKGLGRFPATSLHEPMDTPAPGSYALLRKDGANFVRLTSPRFPYLGTDELFRFSQRVSVNPGATYRVALQVRVPRPTSISVEICEKQLLYRDNCSEDGRAVNPSSDWQLLELTLKAGTLGAAAWYAPKPVFFAVAVGDPAAYADVRSVRMVAVDGTEVLANGDFANRTARWFSSSDKYHLPWRIENMFLDVLFGQGLLGLASFALLVASVLLRTSLGRAARHPDAPFIASAIVASVIVGEFDSLTDVPRDMLLFYVLVIVGFMLRNPRVERAARPGSTGQRNESPEDLEKAARALRRQAAFGQRQVR